MLRVLVLTEDGSKDAHATLVALAKKMLRLVDEGCQTNLVAFEPAAEDVVHIARANKWKSAKGKDRQKVVALRRSIATRLAEEQGLVLFHVDGDVPWSRRHASENRQRLDEIEQPKQAVCLGSKHNHDLARNAFPHRDAYQAGTSFAAAVETLRACPDLGPALAQTRPR